MNGSYLVNCHTHLEQSWLAEMCPRPPGRPFAAWIGDLVEYNRQHRASGDGQRRIVAGIEKGIEILLEAGTTHVGDITQTGFSIEPLLASGLAGVVYMEVIGLAQERWQETFERARRWLEQYRPQERNGLRLGLSPHAAYSTHPDAFAAVIDLCQREDVPLCIHAAESPAEVEALVDGRGVLFNLSARLGLEPPAAPGMRPIPYLASLGVLECRPLLVHMVQVTDEELDIVAQAGAKVAHCPRSNTLLQCGRMPLEKMLARGIPVALGTDSLASSPSLDVREEAETAVVLHGGRVNETTIRGLIKNGEVLG